MPFAICELTEDDATRAAELLNLGASEPVTVEQMRERLGRRGPGRIVARLGAVNSEGALVGYGHAIREGWMDHGLFWMHIVVDPAVRNRGSGGQLHDALLDFTRAYGGAALRGEVRDDAPNYLRFAERRGWRIERHIFESMLDLVRFDERPFVAALDRVLASGIRFVTMDELGDTDDARRRLYELERTVARDIPGGSEVSLWTYETFLQRLCESPGYRPDAMVVARDGQTWVGECSVQANPATNSMYNGLTGVLPSHRGRGIAQALKLLAIRVAKRRGLHSHQQRLRERADAGDQPQAGLPTRAGLLSAGRQPCSG
jgi:GNAT superfamily N-acetyltransferase